MGNGMRFLCKCIIWGIPIAAIVWFIHDSAYKKGLADARLECSKGQTQQAADSLNQFIASTQELTSQANTASRQLAIQIAARAAADDQSSREIRDALKKTAAARVNCMFDADIMQQLAAARERAATAAVSGITPRTEREMSGPAGPGG